MGFAKLMRYEVSEFHLHDLGAYSGKPTIIGIERDEIGLLS
jgi:hypothetical protein